MKVLTILVNPGHAGGAENAACELVRELKKNEIYIDVAAMGVNPEADPNSSLNIKTFKPRQLPIRSITKFIIGTSIHHQIDFSRYDIVHIHNVQPPRALKQIARECLRLNIPYTITTHGFIETATRSGKKIDPITKYFIKWLIDKPLKFALSHANMVTALTQYEIPFLKDYGVRVENIEIIYNGIKSEVLEKKYNQVDLVKKYSLTNEPIVLYVGNLKPNKGLDILIKATNQLTQGQVVIVGGGINNAYEKSLRELAANQTKVRIIFTGRVDNNELMSWYETCAIFILPTRGDTLPLVILDAMAFKKPVVASRIGGIPEEVDEHTGILVQPNDVNELAQALNHLLTDEKTRQEMGEAGYRKAIEKFTWPKVAGKVIQVYQILSNK